MKRILFILSIGIFLASCSNNSETNNLEYSVPVYFPTNNPQKENEPVVYEDFNDFPLIANEDNINVLVSCLTAKDCVYGSAVGIAGTYTREYACYQKLCYLLSDKEMFEFVKHPNPNLRLYAIQDLFRTNSEYLVNAQQLLKNDTARVCIFSGCSMDKFPIMEQWVVTTDKSQLKLQSDSTTFCAGNAIDFMKLKDKNLQAILFYRLDSVRKAQYPNNDQEKEIFIDLTPEYLDQFLNDLNQDSLRLNGMVDKEYHFNIAPKDYSDPETCKDKIELVFDEENCIFRVTIFNTFLVEPDWCTESNVVYGFEIKTENIMKRETIIRFWRNEAG